MTVETIQYHLWIDWENHRASTDAVPGFEVLTFYSQESYQSNIKLLRQSGFCFI